MTRRWYARSPWKDALSHSVAVVVAILCTLAIKECTGVAVPVEAQTAPAEPSAASTVFAVAPVIVSAVPSAAVAPAAAAPVMGVK